MASVGDFCIEEDIVTSDLGDHWLIAVGLVYLLSKKPIVFCIGNQALMLSLQALR